MRSIPPARAESANTDGRMLPNYRRTRDWLVEYISTNKLEPGNKMPSERDLANALALSRPTIARAVAELIKEGVLERRERSGTYVAGHDNRRSGSHSGAIGLIMPWLSYYEPSGGGFDAEGMAASVASHSISSQILHGVMSVIKDADIRLEVHSNASVVDEVEALRNLPDEGLEGALIVPTAYPGTSQLYTQLAKSGPPVVLMDRYFPDCPLDRVVTDNLAAARQATHHLLEMGHTRIAYFGGLDDMTSERDRERGYREALDAAGIAPDEDIICGRQITHHNHWEFAHSLEHCLRLPDPITAVFCVNDNAVMAVLRAAGRLGVRIPGDLTVAGFFDHAVPPGIEVSFTRVVQDMVEVGRTAAKLLLERIAGKEPAQPRHITVPAALVP